MSRNPPNMIAYTLCRSLLRPWRCICEWTGTYSTKRPSDTNICMIYPTYGDPMMISLFVTKILNIMTSLSLTHIRWQRRCHA